MKFSSPTDSVTMTTMTGVTDMLTCVRVKVFVEPPPVARITLSLTPAMTLPAPEVTLGVTSMTGLLNYNTCIAKHFLYFFEKLPLLYSVL